MIGQVLRRNLLHRALPCTAHCCRRGCVIICVPPISLPSSTRARQHTSSRLVENLKQFMCGSASELWMNQSELEKAQQAMNNSLRTTSVASHD